jgi:signal transduction histidine kinase
MQDLLSQLFANDGFLPQGSRYTWQPGVLWLNVGADAIIALAYFTIPFSLLYLTYKRRDLLPLGFSSVFVLFALMCGLAHLISVWTVWEPYYWLEGTVKAFAAVSSLMAIIVIWPSLPRVFAMPSRGTVERTNAELQEEVSRRLQAEDALFESHVQLERRVQQRTEELLDANRRLGEEVLKHQQTEQALHHSEVLFRRLNDQLEEHVAERTAELTATVAELEAFSYSISHDLRAPLRAINGYAAIVRGDYAEALGSGGTALLARIEANASRMATLIDGLLDFSRLGRVEAVAQEVNMRDLVNGIVAETQADTPGVATQIIVGDLPPARGDAAMLRQVWVNLLTNAIKFSGQRADPRIEVQAVRDGNDAVYSVKDNGVGFDMAYAEKLFGVFNRLHAVDEFPGVGVGLAIVRRIVTRHGGRVWAESASGEGATFYFSLPAVAGEAATRATP